MKNTTFSYVVCDKDFFLNGHGGKVSHAFGVVNGLAPHIKSLNFFVPSSSLDIVSKHVTSENVQIVPVRKSCANIFYANAAIKSSLASSDYVLVRKNIYTLVLYIFTFGFAFYKGFNKKIMWEVNGLSFESYKGHPFGSCAYYLFRVLSQFSMRKSVLVYVVSKSIKTELCSGFFGLDDKEVVVVPNGAPATRRRKYTATRGGVNFIFFGVYRPYNEYDIVIEAFKAFNEQSESTNNLHFFGYGPEKKRLNDLSKDVDGVKVWGEINIAELVTNDALEGRSFGIVPISKSFGSLFLSPIKLYDYASIGLPVILSDVYEKSESSCHFVYKSGSSDSLLKQFFRVASMKDTYQDLVSQSYEFARLNSWRQRMKLLLNAMNEKSNI